MITSDLRVLNHKLQEIGHVEKRDSEFVYMLHGAYDFMEEFGFVIEKGQ